MFNKVVVANRGTIAARVLRALSKLGINSVAVYSQADAGLPYLAEADETYCIGPAEPKASYLNQDALIDVLKKSRAGMAYLKKIAVWQAHGYQVKLWFLSLPNEDIAVSRVARRVLQGGHNIPEDVIRRRFKAGLENFHERYSKAVNSWALFDSYHRPPKLIDWSNK